MPERQITFAPHGHILTNTAVWSPDCRRIVYDVRSDRDGSVFDGTRIETVDVETGEVSVLYESRNGACCGVATWHPTEPKVVFILGPENPAPDWTYGASRRQGVIVDATVAQASTLWPNADWKPVLQQLDARDMSPPFTPGALRGGSHVHVFSPDGNLVSFTYEDQWLSRYAKPGDDHDISLRNIGVSFVGKPVVVPKSHPRNHDGSAFSVLVTRATARPIPGSDQYRRACEEGWIGTSGYSRADGTRQSYALAFLGDVTAKAPVAGACTHACADQPSEEYAHESMPMPQDSVQGRAVTEVFIADLPDDLSRPGEGPLQGTESRSPDPPMGVMIRRLTHTADRRFPGVQGVRHWVRSSPDGSLLAFLMRDDAGVSQIFTVSPSGGGPIQLSRNATDITSAFTWSSDGRLIAHAMDGSMCVTDATSGETRQLTIADSSSVPCPLAAVFSPDGRRIAYLRRVPHADGNQYNQIFVVDVE